MPIIYLSPSTQEYNNYVDGGTEEQYMNLLADKMVPYLLASGIRYSRNTPDMTAAQSIAASNAGNYDLHLALHSNASPEGSEGAARGIIVFYYPGSEAGQRAATIIANNLKAIYPLPDQVVASPPPPSARCAGCGPRRPSWSWATMTTPRTRSGFATIWTPWPRIWSCPWPTISSIPLPLPLSAPAAGRVDVGLGGC